MSRLIPNILTFGRLIFAVVILVMLLYAPQVENKSFFIDVAFVLLVVGGLTDMIDGAVARRLGVTSKLGRMMDPLVDKVLVCGAFICFALIGEPKLFDLSGASLAVIHWGVVVMIVAREAYVTILRHIAEAKGINFAATQSGKLKMFLQIFTISTVMIKMAHVPTTTWGQYFTTVTYLIMLAVTVFSGIRATRRPAWRQAMATGVDCRQGQTV